MGRVTQRFRDVLWRVCRARFVVLMVAGCSPAVSQAEQVPAGPVTLVAAKYVDDGPDSATTIQSANARTDALVTRTTDGAGLRWSTSATALRRAAKPVTRGADDAFHYTRGGVVDLIEKNGLRPGSYLTKNGDLSPLQAQLDLALPPNRGLSDALVRVDLAGMRKAGSTSAISPRSDASTTCPAVAPNCSSEKRFRRSSFRWCDHDP